jgi:hypothetical protein
MKEPKFKLGDIVVYSSGSDFYQGIIEKAMFGKTKKIWGYKMKDVSTMVYLETDIIKKLNK